MNTLKRIGDIISANISSALDRAEDPEKMINLSIRKLEDARTDIRKTIAGKETEKNSVKRRLSDERKAEKRWEERAQLAIIRGLDEMAREAAEAKLEIARKAERDEELLSILSSVISSLRETLGKIDERLAEMKSRSGELKARAQSARKRIRANEIMEKNTGAEWEARLEELSSRIEKWEAEADITAPSSGIRPCFESIEKEEAIENELRRIKERMKENA